MQTYLKCQLSIYYQDDNPIPPTKEQSAQHKKKQTSSMDDSAADRPSLENELTQMERSQFILYYYLLFTNDCESYEDFRFAAGMLEEYMSLNLRELKRQQNLS